jgi:hypothetical protein
MKQMTLADGRTFDPATKTFSMKGEPDVDSSEPVSFVPEPARELRLEDLPADPKQMSVVCAVLGFRLVGLPDVDIALALGCSDAQLFDITNSRAFAEAFDMAMSAYMKGQQSAAKDIIAGGAIHAAQTLVKVARSSKNESNKLRASEGILNRVGINDANMNSMDGGLVIRVVKDTKTSVEIKVG